MSRFLTLVVGAAALAALSVFCVRNHAESIQADIGSRTSTSLSQSGYQFAGVNVDGREIALVGTAPSEAAKSAAGSAARSIRGVRTVDNQLMVVDLAAAAQAAASTCQSDFNALLSADKIRFQTSRAELSIDGTSLLDNLAAVAANCPSASIEIAGHTDSIGDAQMNQNLSQARATAVRDYLMANGISGERLTAVGYGETAPVTSNGTSTGRATNRRIEFRVAGVE